MELLEHQAEPLGHQPKHLTVPIEDRQDLFLTRRQPLLPSFKTASRQDLALSFRHSSLLNPAPASEAEAEAEAAAAARSESLCCSRSTRSAVALHDSAMVYGNPFSMET